MNKVIKICGEFPENFNKIVFENNPTFVFENDINYPSRAVTDSEGNSVVVNSFIECENYVSGGWDFLPIENYEILLQNWVLLIFVSTYVIKLGYSKIKKFNDS